GAPRGEIAIQEGASLGPPHHAAPGRLYPRGEGWPRSGGAAHRRGRIRAQGRRKLPGVMTAERDRPLRGHEAHVRFSPAPAFVTGFHTGLGFHTGPLSVPWATCTCGASSARQRGEPEPGAGSHPG